MIPITLDASVIVKWFHPVAAEPGVSRALAIRREYEGRNVTLFQPPHWRAEVAAVLARLSTSDPARDVSDLCALGAQTIDTTETYVRAARLATRLSQHLFDTLYHAVALDVPDDAPLSSVACTVTA